MSRTAAERAEHRLSLCLDHIVALVGDGFREEAKSVIVANEARAANRAAEAMREAAAKVADREREEAKKTPAPRDQVLIAMTTARDIAAAIRTLPLTDPPPDPREATIARLPAELEAAREAPKHIEQMTRSLAVGLVDGIKEYTMEFSASPRAHRAEYDLVEQKLSEFARAVLAKLSKGE